MAPSEAHVHTLHVPLNFQLFTAILPLPLFPSQEPERMAGVGRGKRQGRPAAQELDRMRARQVQRLAAPELERRRARLVAVGGGRPRGSPSGCGCGRWRRLAPREPKQRQVWARWE